MPPNLRNRTVLVVQNLSYPFLHYPELHFIYHLHQLIDILQCMHPQTIYVLVLLFWLYIREIMLLVDQTDQTLWYEIFDLYN